MMSLVEELNITTNVNLKRLQEHEDNESVSDAKKVCVDFDRSRKKKIAMLVVYSGQGYLGLQRYCMFYLYLL